MSFRNLPETKREEEGLTYFEREPVTVNGQEYHRYAIQTHFVQRGESYLELVEKYVRPLYRPGDILSLSEKIISMCQNNVVEKKRGKSGLLGALFIKICIL